MIYGIKIYNSWGILIKEISPDEALKLYDKENENVLKLSENERRAWNKYIEGSRFRDPPSKNRQERVRSIRNKNIETKPKRKTIMDISPEMEKMVEGWRVSANKNKAD